MFRVDYMASKRAGDAAHIAAICDYADKLAREEQRKAVR